MSVNFNFFDWLRSGVKQSVIMGVADAVEHLGTPREGDEVGQRLLGFLQPADGPSPARISNANGPRPPRKLGRTIRDIQASAAQNGTVQPQ